MVAVGRVSNLAWLAAPQTVPLKYAAYNAGFMSSRCICGGFVNPLLASGIRPPGQQWAPEQG